MDKGRCLLPPAVPIRPNLRTRFLQRHPTIATPPPNQIVEVMPSPGRKRPRRFPRRQPPQRPPFRPQRMGTKGTPQKRFPIPYLEPLSQIDLPPPRPRTRRLRPNLLGPTPKPRLPPVLLAIVN